MVGRFRVAHATVKVVIHKPRSVLSLVVSVKEYLRKVVVETEVGNTILDHFNIQYAIRHTVCKD